nr:polyadenylate-binding protein-interacting protein 12-like isoform X1 [Ipomoea batatas]
MRELEDMFSKLNPMAEEFVPLSLAKNGGLFPNNTNPGRRKRSYNQGKRRMNARTSLAQREEVIRRTVYVSDIDHQITEEQLAALFLSCGQTEDEREMCARTVYCTNIDKKVSQADVKLFFETICGEVYRLRLLGDYHHSTRIAFVEFAMAESAIAALSCSGVVLGSLPIRVSPSKTPVRPRSPRPQMHGINIASAD